MNFLCDPHARPAALVLEDGTYFGGYAAGAVGEVCGEIVFNTSMVGYQEILTDPSYAGQIVTLTYPQVGNYGIDEAVSQADTPALRALVVRDLCHVPSNWTSQMSLPAYLERNCIVAIEGVDTRALTRHIRDHGTMRAVVSSVDDLDPERLVATARASEPISNLNLVAAVSKPGTLELGGAAEGAPRVVALDCGMKRGIEQGLARAGLDVTVVPWDTPAVDVLALHPDGVFVSNGPGDPASVPETTACVRDLLGRVPLFGICLGNQMVARAAGAQTEKLPFGHHGGNEPVVNLLTGRVEITAQNHNYGLVWPSLGPLVPEESGGYDEHVDDLREWARRGVAPVVRTGTVGRVRLTHVNLNDGTPEGIQLLDARAFSVQYHPEANPGPRDAAYLFDAFARLVAGADDYLEQVSPALTQPAYASPKEVAHA